MGRMSPPPADPFAPPGAGDGGDESSPNLALGRDPRRPAAHFDEETLPPVPPARQPVAYKKPPGGIGNFALFAMALVGLGAVVLYGARLMQRGVEGASSTAGPGAPVVKVSPAAAPAPPAAKPVVWKALPADGAVLITVEVSPRTAQLLLDGEPMPSNPVRLPKGKTHTITGVADGYQAASVQVTPSGASTVKLKLKRAR